MSCFTTSQSRGTVMSSTLSNASESSCSSCDGWGAHEFEEYKTSHATFHIGKNISAAMQRLGVSTVTDTDESLASDANALRAKEISELPPAVREKIMDEIHGVVTYQSATATDVTQAGKSEEDDSLIEFQYHIDRTPHKPAYNQAKLMRPSYVKDRKLCLMALRAERNDARAAAVRFIRHFEYKLKLFGLDALARDIVQDDLDEDDLRSMYLGYYQVLPERDRSGRPVVIMAQEFQDFKSQISQNKLSWYLMMKTLQDDEHGEQMQKLGYVGVMYNVGMTEPGRKFMEQAKAGSDYIDSVLVHYSAVHYCYNDARLQPAIAIFQLALGRSIRIRFRAHYGSHIECQHALLSFGIPTNVFIVDLSGNIRNEAYQKILSAYQSQEHISKLISASSGAIFTPGSNDVLLGRGKSYQNFPGNKVLASIITEKRPMFSGLKKKLDKTRMIKDVIEHIQDTVGGRFLKRSTPDGPWEVASESAAHEKVAHAFRNTRLGR